MEETIKTIAAIKPYEKRYETSKGIVSALPFALWAAALLAASVWLTVLNSAQQIERHRALKHEIDELRKTIIKENIENDAIRSKAEKLADTLRSMGWTPPKNGEK